MEFHFKKKYGQNFLTDENLLDAIVRDADIDGGTVLEIGAGVGALTRALQKRAKRVVAFEIDRELEPVLSPLKKEGNVELVFSDFMRESLPDLEEKLGEYRVVANLPYYITTPVLMRFVEEGKKCLGFTVMVQEEVALRLCAKEGTPEYGAVTAALGRRAECHITRRVPKTMFHPRPNVDSAVVRADFTDPVKVLNERCYRAVVRCAFSGRRKTLENNLMNGFHLTRDVAKELLQAAAIPDSARGETLSPAAFAHLSDILYERNIFQG